MKKRASLLCCFILIFSIGYAQQLKPLDGIKLTIFNIPESVTGEYYILENNSIKLPFLDPIDNNSKSYEVLKTEITEKYNSIYREPELSIEPLYRVNVLGEVRNPGTYYITGIETITDVIGIAGGQTQDSDLSEVIVTRNNSEITIDMEEILEDGATENDIKILPGDKIYVTQIWFGGARNTSVILSAFAAVIAAVVTIIVSN
jgi:polysaccharide export outer membrane protein